jgi:predicted nucleotidyltransferase
MKHDELLEQLVDQAEVDSNILGYLVFGSVATGTQREDSDIDVISVRESGKPASGITNTNVEDIKVGDMFMTYDILAHSVEHVPYLLHTLVDARLLFDRHGTVAPLQSQLQDYYTAHPEVVAEWEAFYRQFRAEKAQYGYEKTTIIEVWNELEKRHSGGKTKRRFFNAFYFARPRFFAIVKWFMFLSAPEPKPQT